MKKILFLAALMVTSISVQGQNNQPILQQGDIVVLNTPSSNEYLHVDFPKQNILIKRGAVASYNTLVGEKLVVEQITTTSDGTTKAILKRENGEHFFRFFPNVSANITKAIEKGELEIVKNGSNSL